LRAAFISEGRAQPIPKTLPTLPNADQIRLSDDRQLAIDSSQGGDTISRSLPTPEAVMSRPPLPPFTRVTAAQKARMAEDAWNSRDPERVALAYTANSRWRNRSEFFEGRAAIVAFLIRKWAREHEYRLIKDLWAFDDHRIAVRFQYEWHDDAGQWHRSYGNEQWEFDEHGLMRRREASINDVAIAEADRRFRWAAPGPRPADVPGLGESPF
jgi:nuclear transport factor 2 (NTF2) superfamily protein